jgi:membrane-bound ClpP family serine protease
VSYNFTSLALVCTVAGGLVFLLTIVAPSLGAYMLGGAALMTVGFLMALRRTQRDTVEERFVVAPLPDNLNSVPQEAIS